MIPALPKEPFLKNRKSGVIPALPNGWSYVYLLKGKDSGWIYIGCTNNLEKRFEEHSSGKVFSTRRILPVELIYFETFRSKEHAFHREKSLKKYGSGLARLKARIGRAG